MGKYNDTSNGDFMSFSEIALRRFTEFDAFGGIYKRDSVVSRLVTRNGRESESEGLVANDVLDQRVLEQFLKGLWKPVS